jgi:MFS family permease
MTTAATAGETKLNANVWMLFLLQALVNAAGISQVAISALIGHSLAEDKTLATLPFALQQFGQMAASIPAGIIFARLGRKVGFMLGALSMLLGTGIFFWGVYTANFLIFSIGAVPVGIGFGIGQHYRFAASEVAPPALRPRAIALVMAGGVISAILGPEIVKHTKDIAGPILFLGTYMALGILPLISMVLLWLVKLPPAPPRVVSPTPLGEIMRRPSFITAVIAGLVGYGTMNLIMAATPLEMMLCGYGVDASTDVIRAHALAMFAPGFVTGRLIQRFGVHNIIVIGGVLCLGCAGMSLLAPVFLNFMVALAILGLGWNFMFVGATTLLATAHAPAERVRAQAANDFIVFTTVTLTAFTSGALHDALGWAAVNFSVVPFVLVAIGLVVWHRVAVARAVPA